VIASAIFARMSRESLQYRDQSSKDRLRGPGPDMLCRRAKQLNVYMLQPAKLLLLRRVNRPDRLMRFLPQSSRRKRLAAQKPVVRNFVVRAQNGQSITIPGA
jgi:hypothetical protein